MWKNYMRFFAIGILCLFTLAGKAQKNDSIFHVNGNILLGEIIKLEYGQITYKMDGMGTIMVNVDRVKTIKSPKFFEFTTVHGRTIYGSIDSTNLPGVININSGYDSNNIHLYQIVEIFPIKSTIFLRTSGKIAIGFNYTKGSDIGRFTVDWNVAYRNKGTSLTLSANNMQTFATNDTVATTSKYDINLVLEKKITGIWSWNTYLGGSQNTELGLDLRLKGGLGILGDVIHTNHQRLYAVVGVAPNLEYATTGTSQTYNMEGQLSISYQAFRFSFPNLQINSRLDLFPSLNNLGRYRVDYNLDANVEVFRKFYVGGTFYYSFDNKPASDGASTDDFGFSTTLGYSFHK